MSLSCSTLVAEILAVLCIIQLHESNAHVEVIRQTRHFPNKRLIYEPEYSFEDGRLLYALFDEDNHSRCKIVQESSSYGNVTRSCDVVLAAAGEIDIEKASVAAFGENKAILFWKDSNKTKDVTESVPKIAIIDLDQCTKTEDLKPCDWVTNANCQPGYYGIATYGDSFEVFFRDFANCTGIGCEELKVTINAEGKLVNGPVVFGNNSDNVFAYILPIARYSPSKGYIYYKQNREEKSGVKIILALPDGEEKQIDSLRVTAITSIVDESIGLCKKDAVDSNIVCSQYASNGEAKFKITVNNTDSKAQLLNMYTVPEKGFVLLLIDFEECENTACKNPLGLTMMKVDASGKTVGSIKYKFQQSDKDLKLDKTYMWKSKNDGYCAIVISYRRQESQFDAIGNCFTDADFSS